MYASPRTELGLRFMPLVNGSSGIEFRAKIDLTFRSYTRIPGLRPIRSSGIYNE